MTPRSQAGRGRRGACRSALALLVALAFGTGPAQAGKADDTLRIATTDWWSTLDPYVFTLDEAAVFYGTVYETLLSYDERAHKFVPRLAKSWKQVDDKTIDFTLRDDVTFHNGDKFTADDVVATVKYIVDPAVPLRHKDLYDWVASVEKLGPYEVRITAKTAFPTELSTIAYQFYIFDGKVLGKLANKADYGRTAPVATGPYRVVSLDQTKMVLEKFDGYYAENSPFDVHVKHVIVTHIADRQTQIAQLMTGGVDLIRNVPADMARNLATTPNMTVTARHNGVLMYVTLDAMGRSANKAMTDQRVRRAFMEAIDRKELAKTVIPGGDIAEILDGICVAAVFGCDPSTKPPAYDPEDAKKLLAEAGYPNGLDLELDVHEPVKEIGEAIAGMERKVGIRASVRPLPLSLYIRMRGEGKFTAFLGIRPTNVLPDMNDLCDFFFNGNRDYWNDPVIKEAAKEGELEFDDAKRIKIYQKLIDRVNRKNYILPVADLPMVFVHAKDVRVVDDPLSPITTEVRDYAWSN
jgi:peptide/nickel transport system substrate-binding protein